MHSSNKAIISKIQTLAKTIKNRQKIYIFGAGKNGKELLEYLRKLDIPVEAFIDNNEDLKSVNGKKVIALEQFMKMSSLEDFVLISCGAYEEVEKQLEEAGWKNYMFYGLVPDIKEYVIDYDKVQANEARTAWEKSVNWLLKYKQAESGISYSNKELRAYPEVTGYLIPTLVDYGYYKEAKECVKWLLEIQRGNGGFSDIDNTKEFIFDTAQIMRGLLCFCKDEEIGDSVKRSLEKASGFLYNSMIDAGKGGFEKQYLHDQMIPETILLYTLPPFKDVAILLNRKDYLEAIENCICFYEKQERFLDINDLTHFLAYEIEALIDLGRKDKVETILEELFSSQMKNGAIPSHKNSKWICTPGTAQIALCELKLGRIKHAEKILEWMRSVQMPGGGFRGSYGQGAWYFAGEEIAWAVKYFLDAERLYIEKWFDSNTDEFPDFIESDDARCQIILDEASELCENSKIVEIGCGKGRIIKKIIESGYKGEIDGVDISKELLSYIPNAAKKIHGKMESIPVGDNFYDLVFCVEALEHSQNREVAVSEMVRILKPKGKLIIIDKDRAYWGLMRCSEWENWIGKKELTITMKKHLNNVTVHSVSENMEYMLVWKGQK